MSKDRNINHLAVRLAKAVRLKEGLNPKKNLAKPSSKTSVQPQEELKPTPKNGDLVRGKRSGWNVDPNTEDFEELYPYPNNNVEGILFVNPVNKTALIDPYTQYLVSKVGVDPATIQILKTSEDLEKMVK